MARTIGEALLSRGIASLALDLPLHGERHVPGWGISPGSFMEMARHWRLALEEASLGVSYLGARPETDRGRLAVIGYSLGSYIALTHAAGDARVKAVVLAAGGDLPDLPFAALARTFIDPQRSARALEGRPLLMVHGRRDRTIAPAQAERLYAAAREPKSIRWYDSGHILPALAGAEVAEWLGAAI
jgi:fermentation-respiration switch protein FrsA (DUF1100 family)